MTLPTDARGEASQGFFKPLAGQTEILILGPAVTGYQYWQEGDAGVVRSRTVFDEPLPNVRKREVEDKKTGVKSMVDEKQQFYWALPVYNFATKTCELWQITQKGVREALLGLQNNAKWGDPTGKYSITIDKSGQGLLTEYKLTPNPIDDAQKVEIAAIMGKFKGMDIESILFGNAPAEVSDDPKMASVLPEYKPEGFVGEAATVEPAVEAQAAPAVEETPAQA